MNIILVMVERQCNSLLKGPRTRQSRSEDKMSRGAKKRRAHFLQASGLRSEGHFTRKLRRSPELPVSEESSFGYGFGIAGEFSSTPLTENNRTRTCRIFKVSSVSTVLACRCRR